MKGIEAAKVSWITQMATGMKAIGKKIEKTVRACLCGNLAKPILARG